ncbi:hypothetical protein DPMN_033816, partial [Dreissena polymorpha]
TGDDDEWEPYLTELAFLPDKRLRLGTPYKFKAFPHGVSTHNIIRPTREIRTSSDFYFVCCMSPSHMVVGTYDDPHFDHFLTFTMKTYKVDESMCTYVRSNNTLVLTDRFAHTVYTYDTAKGTSRAVTNENIQEPRGACVGPGDSVLVCSMRKDSIVHLTIDGKILGTYPVDMKFSNNICVSKDGNRLAVSNSARGNTKLKLYNITSNGLDDL